MLKEVDRIQIACHDADEASIGWVELLGAEGQSEDRVDALGAKRTTYRLGRGEIEFLEPDGAGAIAQALKSRGRPHLYAAGASTDDVDGFVDHVCAQGVEVAVEDGRAYLNPADALGVDFPMVVSPAEDRPRVGRIDFLYEVTLLADDPSAIVSRMASLFGLDESNFEPIHSETFGYSGVLTLFSADNLHRFEVIHPEDEQKTMGRFFKRNGPCLYMAFAETSDPMAIEARAQAAGAGITIDRPPGRSASLPADQMWLHPPALGGVMLGLSRPTMAWKWSGHPERVEAVE